MVYLQIGEHTLPASFGNAAFMRYEDLTNSSAFGDFAKSVPVKENGEVDVLNAKIGFFAKITYCALLSGGNIARQPLKMTLDEVADLITLELLPYMI